MSVRRGIRSAIAPPRSRKATLAADAEADGDPELER